MDFLPQRPKKPRGAFLPAKHSPAMPVGNYINRNAESYENILIPYQPSGEIHTLPVGSINFNLLLEGKLPFIIAPPGSLQKAAVNAQLAILLENLNNINAWEDMLIQLHALPGLGGQVARLYIINSRSERYLVLQADLDPGGETGTLLLQPLGRAGRSGRKINLDPESLIDYSAEPPKPWGLPVILYKPSGVVKKNPDEDIRRLERQAGDDPSKLEKLLHARLRTQLPISDLITDIEKLRELLKKDPYLLLEVKPSVTDLYNQTWLMFLFNQMFHSIVAGIWEIWEPYWQGVLESVSTQIYVDTKNYSLEVTVKMTTPSEDEAEERESMLQNEFTDWVDNLGISYELIVEYDDWSSTLDMEPEEDTEDDVDDDTDVPQEVTIELEQPLGLHHLFALIEYSDFEVEDIIPNSILCHQCGGKGPCEVCFGGYGERGELLPNSNRRGYVTGSNWKYLPGN